MRRSGIDRRRMIAGTAVMGMGLAMPWVRRADAQEKTINVLTLGEGIFGDPFVKLAPEFTAATGIKVNNVTMGYGESMQKQAAVFAAGAPSSTSSRSTTCSSRASRGRPPRRAQRRPRQTAALENFFADTPATAQVGLEPRRQALRHGDGRQLPELHLQRGPPRRRRVRAARHLGRGARRPRRRWSRPTRTATASSPVPSG